MNTQGHHCPLNDKSLVTSRINDKTIDAMEEKFGGPFFAVHGCKLPSATEIVTSGKLLPGGEVPREKQHNQNGKIRTHLHNSVNWPHEDRGRFCGHPDLGALVVTDCRTCAVESGVDFGLTFNDCLLSGGYSRYSHTGRTQFVVLRGSKGKWVDFETGKPPVNLPGFPVADLVAKELKYQQSIQNTPGCRVEHKKPMHTQLLKRELEKKEKNTLTVDDGTVDLLGGFTTVPHKKRMSKQERGQERRGVFKSNQPALQRYVDRTLAERAYDFPGNLAFHDVYRKSRQTAEDEQYLRDMESSLRASGSGGDRNETEEAELSAALKESERMRLESETLEKFKKDKELGK